MGTVFWRHFIQEWRAGEVGALVLAFAVAVAAFTAVDVFSQRIGSGLQSQGAALLGADLVISSPNALDQAYLQAAQRGQLRHTQTLVFTSMVQFHGHAQLASVHGVQAAYPLRGKLQVAADFNGRASTHILTLAPKTAWLEPRLAVSLGLNPGDTVQLGYQHFKVAGLLMHEPGRGGDIFNLAPRMVISYGDIAATGLIQPGSRVRHQMLFAGDSTALQAFRHWLEPRLKAGESSVGLENARPEFTSALAKGQQFLQLSALTSVILAAIALVLAARHYVNRHLDHCAIWRTLGASQHFISTFYGAQIGMIALLGIFLGVSVGYGAAAVLAHFFSQWYQLSLPAANFIPAFRALGLGLLCLAGFVLPSLWRLRHTPALRILRRDLDTRKPHLWFSLVMSLMVMIALVLWGANEWQLTLLVILGVVVMAAVVVILVFFFNKLLAMGASMTTGLWRFSLQQAARSSALIMLQTTALSIGIMLLLVLFLVREDVLTVWQQRLPEQAPNRFLMNIMDNQREDIRNFFQQHALNPPQFFPMVRGRLVGINQRSVSVQDFDDERAQRLVQREFNVSWTRDLPAHNRLSAGQWWQDQGKGQGFSVEKGIAETLHIQLNDELAFLIDGQEVRGTVVNLREVDWDSFQVNFFVIATPTLIEKFPALYLSSFYLAPEKIKLLPELVRRFPNISVIDVAAVMTQVRTVIQQVLQSVEMIFLFTLFAGLTVLYTALHVSQDQRREQQRVLRTLGASHSQLIGVLLLEFSLMGVIAGVVASLGAAIIAGIMAHSILNITYIPRLRLLVYGMGLVLLCVFAVAYAVNYRILHRPPQVSLQQG